MKIKIKNFDCSRNNLFDLEGSPERIEHNFITGKFLDIKRCPKYVGKYFMIRLNLEKFKYTEDDIRKICHVGEDIIFGF